MSTDIYNIQKGVITFILLLCCVIVLVFSSPDLGRAKSQDITQVPGVEKVTKGLLNKLQRDIATAPEGSGIKSLKVIVGLHPLETEIERKKAFKDKKLTKLLRSNIRKKQDKVLEKMLFSKSKAFKVINRYQNLYAFSAMVDSTAVIDLVAVGEVSYIEEMRVHYKSDGQAFPLTNTDQAHAAGWTGEGITIAVIDDGIEHDHPAFGGHTGFPNAKIPEILGSNLYP